MSIEPHLVNQPALSMPPTTKFIGAVEDEWQLFSDRAVDYTIGEPIGFGASSIVYSATYRPVTDDTSVDKSKGTPCALKVLDLDSLPLRSLQLLQRETNLMSLSKHPNVLRVRGSWMDGHKLYIALRLMNKGSAADVMYYGWPGGMEEDVVRCILRQALKGLNYLHINGFIHRDIKAANLLIDNDGTVLLGDLGVAADLAEDTSHINPRPHSKFSITSSPGLSQVNPSAASINSGGSAGKRALVFEDTRPKIGKRKSFVGTPCWMAPELIQGKQYDSKADIWSFGITALELSQGRPPRSRESPQSVLLRTIQEDAPTLDREGGTYKYSRAFKEVVDWCLNKDPAKRPTAEELLRTPFFKGAKKKSYLINTILKDLPPLTQRQERRSVAHITSTNSIDSWDFATTVHPSPTTQRQRFSDDPTVFVMEEEHNPRIAHSPEPSSGADETDNELDGAAGSPGTSDSSLRNVDLDDSPSSIPSTSTPSSYTEGSELAWDSGEPLASIAEHASQPPVVVSLKPQTPRQSPIGLSSSSSSEPSSRRTMWQKFKTNVKTSSPSSRMRDSQSSDSSLPVKAIVGGVFSAGKGLLSGNSSPRI